MNNSGRSGPIPPLSATNEQSTPQQTINKDSNNDQLSSEVSARPKRFIGHKSRIKTEHTVSESILLP
jgi:ABC-type transport system involved in cytochrome c biogenesis ATPase subunit